MEERAGLLWRTGVRIGLLVGVIVLDGCDRSSQGQANEAEAAAVVRVGRQTIRSEQVKRILRKLPEERVRELEGDVTQRRQLLEPLVRDNVLYEEALRRDLLSRPEVAAQVKRLAIRALRKELLAEVGGDADVGDGEVQAAYEEGAQRYRRAPRMRAMGIFVGSRVEAERIHAEIRNRPHDLPRFSELATQHSLHAESKRRGGDLGFFPHDGPEAASEVARVALSIKEPFGLAPVFQDGEHWVVLLKTAEIPGFEVPFDRVKEGIRQRLARKRRQRGVKDYIDQLRRRAEVSIDEQVLTGVFVSLRE